MIFKFEDKLNNLNITIDVMNANVTKFKVDTSNFLIVQIPAPCYVIDPCQTSYFLQILVNYDNR